MIESIPSEEFLAGVQKLACAEVRFLKQCMTGPLVAWPLARCMQVPELVVWLGVSSGWSLSDKQSRCVRLVRIASLTKCRRVGAGVAYD